MLADVVSIPIREKWCVMALELIQNDSLDLVTAVFHNSLEDTAAVYMAGKFIDISPKSFEDEADISVGNKLNGLLHDVVAMLVLRDFQDVPFQLPHEFVLLVHQDVFEGLDVTYVSTGNMERRKR